MMNLINFLQVTGQDGGDTGSFCYEAQPILKIVGIVVLAIKIVVPIILIVVGMLDLAKAVGEKDEGKIKEAQNKLVKRAIAAVLVFLVATLVGIIFSLLGKQEYRDCMNCINHPFSKSLCPNGDIKE